MPTIEVLHLRYQRERDLEIELAPMIARARQSLPDLQQRIDQQVRGFFEHVSTSVRVSGLPAVDEVIQQVRVLVGLECPVDVFLSQQPAPSAQCKPQFAVNSQQESGLTILLSQHYFNLLDTIERRVILGHELGHYLFGHLGIPSQPILEAARAENSLGETAALLYKWSLCREISCDLVGLAVGGNDWEACGLALLKFTSGLDKGGVGAVGGAKAVIDGVLSQYDAIADSVHDGALNTHPLDAVRLRVLQTASRSGLLQRFGEECSDSELQSLQDDLWSSIDRDVFPVYPQLKPQSEVTLDDDMVLLDLAMAVAMADGHVDPRELSAMGQLLSHSLDAESFLRSLQKASGGDAASMCDQLVTRAQEAAVERGFQKADVVGLVRRVMQVAIADGKVSNDELKVLFSFLKPYKVSKEELVYIAQQSSSPRPTR